MGRILFAIVFLVIGGVIGLAAGATIGFGGGAGVGVATGLSAGICSVSKASQDEGLLTAEQVDQVFTRAVENLRALSPEIETESEQIVGGAAECDAVLARISQAASK